MQKYSKLFIAPYRYYKNKKYKKLKNVLLIGLYLAVVVFIINLANTNSLADAYAYSSNDANFEDQFKLSNGTIESIGHLSVREKLEMKFYQDYIGNSDIAYFTVKYSNQYELPPSLLIALMKVESTFDVKAVNYNKNRSVDRGLCQLNSYVFKNLKVEDFFNPELNISLGAKQLRWCLDISNNKLTKGLAMYNAGFGQVKNKRVGEMTLDYIQKITDEKELIDLKLASYIKSYSDILY